MVMQASTNGSVRFGVFEFNPDSYELRKNGAKVKLQDQPGQILSALLEVPGDVVSREEMQKRLWPADTFVDFDHSLNTAIKKLRQALCAARNKPRFVETLPKRGYRFLVGVKRPAPSSAVAETPVAGPAGRKDAAASPWVGR